MRIDRRTLTRISGALLALLAGAALSASLWAQEPYQKPPQAILNVLNAPETPRVSISPQIDLMILAEPPSPTMRNRCCGLRDCGSIP